MNAKPQIFMTIEIKEREFLSKVLLSSALANAGWRVTLGSETSIFEIMKKVGPSILLHKSVHPKTYFFRQLGHIVVTMDEEGGITTPRSTVVSLCAGRFADHPKNVPDVMFLPTNRFEAAIRSLPGSENTRLKVTGWPRVDLWFLGLESQLFEKEAFNLTQKYGIFYLFASSFGAGSVESFRKFIDDSPNSEVHQVRVHRFRAFERYVELLSHLNSTISRGQRIIVRPHTSESVRDWKETLSHLKNTLVIRSGDVTPWLIASKSLITFGSTVAVQSVLMGKNTVQFDVQQFETVTDSPSFELPLNARSKEEARIMLEAGPNSNLHQNALTVLRAEGAIREENNSVSLILDELEKIKLSPQSSGSLSATQHLYLSARYFASLMKHIAILSGIFKGRHGKSNNRSTFGNLPGGLGPKEIERSLFGFDEAALSSDNISVARKGIHLVELEKLDRIAPE